MKNVKICIWISQYWIALYRIFSHVKCQQFSIINDCKAAVKYTLSCRCLFGYLLC